MTNLNKGNVKQTRKEGGGHSGRVLIKNQSSTKQRKEIQYIDNDLRKLKVKLMNAILTLFHFISFQDMLMMDPCLGNVLATH